VCYQNIGGLEVTVENMDGVEVDQAVEELVDQRFENGMADRFP
jgi:hypothetical protein